MKKINKLISQLREGLSGNDSALESVASMLYEDIKTLTSPHSVNIDTLLTQEFRQFVQFDQIDLSKKEKAHLLSIAAKQIKRVLTEASTLQRDVDKCNNNEVNELVGKLVPELKQKSSRQNQTDYVALDGHLRNLSELDARKATLFELSYFGGMDYEEIAEIITMPIAAIDRELRFARAWVCREINNAH